MTSYSFVDIRTNPSIPTQIFFTDNFQNSLTKTDENPHLKIVSNISSRWMFGWNVAWVSEGCIIGNKNCNVICARWFTNTILAWIVGWFDMGHTQVLIPRLKPSGCFLMGISKDTSLRYSNGEYERFAKSDNYWVQLNQNSAENHEKNECLYPCWRKSFWILLLAFLS